MFKFFFFLFLLAASFGAGYYFGQRPVGTLQQTVTHLSERWSVSQKTIADLEESIKKISRNMLDTTKGIEQDLKRRQGLVAAKAHIVQAKAHILDRNFGEASKELAQAGDTLEEASKGETPDAGLHTLAGRMKELRGEITRGQPLPLKKLNDVQQELDRQLNK